MQSLEEIYFSTAYPLNTTSFQWYENFTNGNNTNLTESQAGNQFILPWWRQMIWTVLFVGMIAVATGGNLIVIWIVMAHKRMRTVTNYFLVNLSIADAMVSTLNVTFNYTYMLNSHWTFGNLYCKISQFIAVLTICASVFTLMAISIDRYMAIMNPLRPRMGRRATLCVAMAIWVVGAILSLPMLLFYTTYTQNFPNGEVRVICYSDWPNRSDDGLSYDEYLYNVIFMILTYFLPIGSMTFTYARVGLELWGSQSIGEATQRQLDNIRSKRRVVKMMIVVVVIFAVCWLPFHVYFIVTSYLPEITNEPYIQELFLAIYWLAMSNSMYNPIIYCWMNSRFRRGFAQFFSWCPGIHVTPEPTLSRSEAVTSRYSCTGSPEANTRISRNGTFTESCSDEQSSDHCTIASTTSRRGSTLEPDEFDTYDDDTSDNTAIYYNLEEFYLPVISTSETPDAHLIRHPNDTTLSAARCGYLCTCNHQEELARATIVFLLIIGATVDAGGRPSHMDTCLDKRRMQPNNNEFTHGYERTKSLLNRG